MVEKNAHETWSTDRHPSFYLTRSETIVASVHSCCSSTRGHRHMLSRDVQQHNTHDDCSPRNASDTEPDARRGLHTSIQQGMATSVDQGMTFHFSTARGVATYMCVPLSSGCVCAGWQASSAGAVWWFCGEQS